MSYRHLALAVLGASALLLASCGGTRSKSEVKETDPAVADAGPQKSTDPDKGGLDFDPTLPDIPKGKPVQPSKTEPTRPKSFIDPGLDTPDITKPKVKFDLPKLTPTTPVPTGPVEVSVPALAKPEPGMVKPELKPRILALTLVGGPGNQWIQRVGWDKAGQIYAESGGGDFTVYYSGDGSRLLGIKGDVKKESSGPRGPPIDTSRDRGAFITTDPTSGIKLEIGCEGGGRVLLPYLESSGEWKWWDRGNQTDLKGMEAKTRGQRVYFMHEGRFLVKATADAGNTILARHPRDIKLPNEFAVNVPKGNVAGPFTFYCVASIKSGEPLLGNFVRGRVLAEAVDPWERLYIGIADKDPFTKGGLAGFSVIDGDLTTNLFSGLIGADVIYTMAIKDDMLLLGGVIGQRPENVEEAAKLKAGLPPEKLRMINPAQADPGGDEDGIFAIIKLW